MKGIFLPAFSKYFMYPLISGKIIHTGLTIASSWQLIKYLKSATLCLNLSDATMCSVFTEIKSIGCLDL